MPAACKAVGTSGLHKRYFQPRHVPIACNPHRGNDIQKSFVESAFVGHSTHKSITGRESTALNLRQGICSHQLSTHSLLPILFLYDIGQLKVIYTWLLVALEVQELYIDISNLMCCKELYYMEICVSFKILHLF